LLGRGVSRLEQGLASADPTARSKYMDGALGDFEQALKMDAGSVEAQYNKAQVLYHTGRHREALRSIDAYLSRDPDSIWAVKLQDLKVRIQASRSEWMGGEIDRAAQARDTRALETLVRIVPGKITAAVVALMRRALAVEGRAALKGTPVSRDLQWAAGSFASLYQTATAGAGAARLMEFYADLSPPQKQAKRTLDARLETLIGSFNKNDFKSPLVHSESLIRSFTGLSDHWQLVRVYQLRGSCCFYGRTDFPAATAEFQKMLESAERTGDPDLTARSLGALASSCIEQHRYDDAFANISRIKELSERHHLDSWNAFACNIAGSTYHKLGNLDQSRREYLSALNLASRFMDPDILLQSMENLGVIEEQLGRYSEAGAFYRQSEQWLRTFLSEGTLPPGPETEARRLNLLYKQGHLALQLQEAAAAKGYFNEALKSRLDGMRELEARNRLGLAQVHIQDRMFGDAERELQAAQRLAVQNSYPEILWQAGTLKGLLLEQRGDRDGAIRSYQEAIETLEKMRENVASLDLRQSFFFRRLDPYRKIVSSIYHHRKDAGQAMAYAARAKAATLHEYLGLHPGLARSGAPASLAGSADASRPLPSGIAALEYFLSADEVFIFVSGPGGTDAVSVPMDLGELQVLARRYADSIRNNDGRSFEALSHRLYQELIGPVLPRLNSLKVDTLAILPDGPLHRVPFGSLMDPGGKFLIENYAISYAPSRGVLGYCLAGKTGGRIGRGTSLLLMDGSSNLPGAGEELERLSKLYPRHALWTPGDDSPLAPEIGNYGIIHFSGHASLYGEKPRLVFQTPGGERYLDSSAIRNWKLKNNLLVTLAGCNTGVGPISDGETPWGLIPSLLSAGASSILVSLLPVDDAATTELTSRFYDTLAQGAFSKAQSLRMAQVMLLRSLGTDARRSPRLWAPFVLIGDPR
jgi:CHAT domain-containing protein/Flp pilus assembly protein TadD